jgi:predicted ester cyclase
MGEAESYSRTGFLAPDYRRHVSPNATSLSLDEQEQRLTGSSTAFPDIQIEVEEVLAKGDHLAIRSTMRGTYYGELMGLEPTGKHVATGLVDVIRVKDGKLVEQWGGPDLYDLLRQLGARFAAAPEEK